MVKTDPADISMQKHVFISGLARAGTTVLMRRFYDSHCFRSLTYQDMPFVLAPNLWKKLSSISRREVEDVERSHGDGLLINFDSPESFDEVFWRIFTCRQYIARESLRPHVPEDNLVHQYIRYVNAILSTESPRKRYLSKNNNNILRLGAIRQAFPNALILIPFRTPLQHAYSLLCQHRHYSERQAASKFELSYMTWLGHYEFGLGHRRFQLSEGTQNNYPPDSLNYWLLLWCEVYSWLELSKPKASFFVAYEDLCSNENVWMTLSEFAEIPSLNQSSHQFKSSNRQFSESHDNSLDERATVIYNRLLNDSRTNISVVQNINYSVV